VAYKNIEDKRTYHRKYMKERRDWFKSYHFCTECGKQDAYTIGGRRLCFDCNEKFKSRKPTEEVYQRKREKSKERYEKRKSEGLCTNCGKPARKGFTKCLRCSIKDRERRRDKTIIPRSERREYGLCARCEKKLNGQKNTDGRDSRLCKACYEKQAAVNKKYRESHLCLRPLRKPFCNTKEAWDNYFKLKKRRDERIKRYESNQEQATG